MLFESSIINQTEYQDTIYRILIFSGIGIFIFIYKQTIALINKMNETDKNKIISYLWYTLFFVIHQYRSFNLFYTLTYKFLSFRFMFRPEPINLGSIKSINTWSELIIYSILILILIIKIN